MPRKFTNLFEIRASTERFAPNIEAELRRLGAIPLWKKSWIVRTILSETELRSSLSKIFGDSDWQIVAGSRGWHRFATFKDKQRYLNEKRAKVSD